MSHDVLKQKQVLTAIVVAIGWDRVVVAETVCEAEQ